MTHLRIAWRQLAAQPGHSAVTILGLAAGPFRVQQEG